MLRSGACYTRNQIWGPREEQQAILATEPNSPASQSTALATKMFAAIGVLDSLRYKHCLFVFVCKFN